MKYTEKNHTFVVCAYKENQYLENCILSLLNQTTPSKVVLCTSTPNDHISGLAEKYSLSMYVNSGKTSLFHDFNFAYSCAETELVTLCHQDDDYYPDYLEKTLNQVNRSKNMIILFTEYRENRKEGITADSGILRVKRLMNFPLRLRPLWGSKWVRRRILSIGNSICCPSVMFHKKAINGVPFYTEYSNSGDWKTWSDLSKLDGDFIYCPVPLLNHRIWEGSETTRLITNNVRSSEDFQILCEFWPKPIASHIMKYYSGAEKSNG